VYVVVLQETFEVTAWQGQPALPLPDRVRLTPSTMYGVWAHVAPTDNKHSSIVMDCLKQAQHPMSTVPAAHVRVWFGLVWA
jgi:hypothetical protein